MLVWFGFQFSHSVQCFCLTWHLPLHSNLLKFLFSYILYRLKGNKGGVSYQLSYRENLTTHMQTIHDQYPLISGWTAAIFFKYTIVPGSTETFFSFWKLVYNVKTFTTMTLWIKASLLKTLWIYWKWQQSEILIKNTIQSKKAKWDRVTVQNYVEK